MLRFVFVLAVERPVVAPVVARPAVVLEVARPAVVLEEARPADALVVVRPVVWVLALAVVWLWLTEPLVAGPERFTDAEVRAEDPE